MSMKYSIKLKKLNFRTLWTLVCQTVFSVPVCTGTALSYLAEAIKEFLDVKELSICFLLNIEDAFNKTSPRYDIQIDGIGRLCMIYRNKT